MRLFFLLLLCSFSVHASPSLYFLKVIESTEVKSEQGKGGELMSIENTQTFRCPGCFEFTLKFRKDAEDGTTVEYSKILKTSLDLDTLEIGVQDARDINRSRHPKTTNQVKKH